MGTAMDKQHATLPPELQVANRRKVDGLDEPADPTPTDTTPLLRASNHAATPQLAQYVNSRTNEPLPPLSRLRAGGLSKARFWVVFSQILATQFLCFFDTTIMVSSHPVITSYFGVAHSASWLSTVFMVMSTVSQPFLGRLSDAFGRKPLCLGALAIFTVATLWCSLATSIESLIAARAVCGIGAGGTMLMGSITMSDIIPIESRGTYLSYLNVVVGIGSGLGATVGGTIAETIGWRWEFGVQVPLLLACLMVGLVTIPNNLGVIGERETLNQVIRGFDKLGALSLTLAVSTLILGLNLGGNIFPWYHPFIVSSLLVFAVAFPAFILIECRATKPIMPLKLISRKPRANLIISNFLGAIISNAILFNAPLYFQAVLLISATSSGLRLMLLAIASSAAGALTGLFITRMRRLQSPLVCAAALYLASIVSICCMRPGLSPNVFCLALVPYSVANGLQYTTTAVAVLATSEHDEQAVVMSALAIWRSLGTVLGVALSSVVVQNGLLYYLNVNVHGPLKDDVTALARASVRAIANLDQPYRDQVVQSYDAALRLAFGSCIAAAAIAAFLIVRMKLPTLGLSVTS